MINMTEILIPDKNCLTCKYGRINIQCFPCNECSERGLVDKWEDPTKYEERQT